MDLLVRGRSATITATFLDGEDPVTGLVGVTVDVVDDEGTAVATALAATESTDSPGTWSAQLTAEHTATCRPLSATWSDGDGTTTTTSELEVIGGHYFDLATFRARHGLEDRTRWPTAALDRARAWVTNLIDTECGTSFVERYHRDDQPARALITRFGTIRTSAPYPRSVLSISLDGSPLDEDAVGALVADPSLGTISSTNGSRLCASHRCVVRYTAGALTSCPADLAEEAMTAARSWLTQALGSSGFDPRALSVTNEFGNLRLSTYTPGFDAALARYRDAYRVPGIA